ncbi:hypothetical protein [Galliscardovia ingluviei]|nr:hypothetical protein [Galliscardovia ingluviei]
MRQMIVIDVEGQDISDDIRTSLVEKIRSRVSVDVEIIFEEGD